MVRTLAVFPKQCVGNGRQNYYNGLTLSLLLQHEKVFLKQLFHSTEILCMLKSFRCHGVTFGVVRSTPTPPPYCRCDSSHQTHAHTLKLFPTASCCCGLGRWVFDCSPSRGASWRVFTEHNRTRQTEVIKTRADFIDALSRDLRSLQIGCSCIQKFYPSVLLVAFNKIQSENDYPQNTDYRVLKAIFIFVLCREFTFLLPTFCPRDA